MEMKLTAKRCKNCFHLDGHADTGRKACYCGCEKPDMEEVEL